jgi:hypothetical protein
MLAKMKATRAEVYAAIDTERDYQDRFWPQDGQQEYPTPLRLGEQLLLAEEYLARARTVWTGEKDGEQQTLDAIRKVAGVLVSAMERHGAVARIQ